MLVHSSSAASCKPPSLTTPSVGTLNPHHPPQLHALQDASCLRFSERASALDMLAGARVGVVRVSVAGWERQVLQGLWPLLEEQRPWVVLLEAFPVAMAAVERGGNGSLVQLMNDLYKLGYQVATMFTGDCNCGATGQQKC